jgi:hypothetical protein
MTKGTHAKLIQSTACLVCLILGSNYGGSEYGSVTGPLLQANQVGFLLFLGAIFLTFFLRRVAAATTILASMLSLPLYLYFTFPGAFRLVFRRPWSVPLTRSVAWDKWAIAGILALLIAAWVGVHNLIISDWPNLPRVEPRSG